ncbi:MAG: hypothetical protein GX677_03205, partial [Treponema sp.]|nr:hypothetical protein [Treponema sp.]
PTIEESAFDDVTLEEPVIEEVPTEETPIEEPVTEEVSTEEAPIEEPVIDEIATEEAPIEEPAFVDINSDNNLTDENINYLTKEEDKEVDSSTPNASLKQDIKSVLLYMDQLLGKLPEDKIIEFAKSDEFTTYKKLFKELGLS